MRAAFKVSDQDTNLTGEEFVLTTDRAFLLSVNIF